MKLNIPIQEVLVNNGERPPKPIVPIYFATVPVRSDIYISPGKLQRATNLFEAAQNQGAESSVVLPITNPTYGLHNFYVSSPDRDHTKSIVESICKGFGLEAEIQ